MQLAYKKLGSGTPLLILHGLYGNSDNWFTIGKKLAVNFEVFLIDLRNHGKSPHSKEHTYQSMQNDLLEFFEDHKIEKAILLGHSMGGKAAMLFALLHPERILKLIIADIAPKAYISLNDYQKHATEHLNIMQAFLSTDLRNAESRVAVENEFSKFVADPITRRFLLKNLARQKDETFYWLINTGALNNALPNMLDDTDFKKAKFDKELTSFPVLFIKGEKSDYILEKDIYLIRQYFPRAEIITIFDAGHWLHSEQPELFLKCVKYFLEG
jgi:pimeloyl-ACP methyl ester carboxylesterase